MSASELGTICPIQITEGVLCASHKLGGKKRGRQLEAGQNKLFAAELYNGLWSINNEPFYGSWEGENDNRLAN